MEERIGYQRHGDHGAAVNYFDRQRGKVPNNSTAAMWFLAELADAEGEGAPPEAARRMLAFLREVQTPDGEMPYELPGEGYERSIPHYQCFQYNAFQLIDLFHFWKLCRWEDVIPVARGLASFLARGVTPEGACRFSCDSLYPRIVYHAHAMAYALSGAARWGLGDYADLSRRCYDWVLARQRPDGSFPFSTRERFFLRDTRAYPANLAMAVFHLAGEASDEEWEMPGRAERQEDTP